MNQYQIMTSQPLPWEIIQTVIKMYGPASEGSVTKPFSVADNLCCLNIINPIIEDKPSSRVIIFTEVLKCLLKGGALPEHYYNFASKMPEYLPLFQELLQVGQVRSPHAGFFTTKAEKIDEMTDIAKLGHGSKSAGFR